jgi:hypothetical protein
MKEGLNFAEFPGAFRLYATVPRFACRPGLLEHLFE